MCFPVKPSSPARVSNTVPWRGGTATGSTGLPVRGGAWLGCSGRPIYSTDQMTTRANASELLIRQRLGALKRAMPGARVGDVTAIHQARVATRRLREALPLMTTGASGRKLE